MRCDKEMNEGMDRFELVSEFQPSGDQPTAIAGLVEGVLAGKRHQTLLGATGTGKTFTIAQVIAQVNKPTLVMAHNKTLAAQLCAEFKEFFPNNAVEYFVSYYDYYQPEAYIPQSDTYIEKDSSINDEIDKLRHSATSALFERRDVIIVASVSCIYGLGSPEEYRELLLSLRVGMEKAATKSFIAWWTSSTTATISTSFAGRSAYGETSWKSSRLRKASRRSASSFSAMKSNGSQRLMS